MNSGKECERDAGGSRAPWSRPGGHGLGGGLVRDGFFRAQAGVGADLQLGEFFFAGWVAFA